VTLLFVGVSILWITASFAALFYRGEAISLAKDVSELDTALTKANSELVAAKLTLDSHLAVCRSASPTKT
jgi:hypothetical protein